MKKSEFEDKKWLFTFKDEVLAEINRKKNIMELEKLIREEASTLRITKMVSKISDNLVTNALIEQFTQEVDNMELKNLSIELKKTHSSHGASKFKVSLKNNRLNAKVGAILSEGEFRCIALAAFLAELSTTNNESGIVFDDPVSSLDHMHRRNLAKSLVNKAEKRQVIIFTHDIHFLHFLEEFCRTKQMEIKYHHITKRPDLTKTGICFEDLPAKARNINLRTKELFVRLNYQKEFYVTGNQSKWYEAVKVFENDMRFLWERSVEEFISDVLKRFSNRLKTQNLPMLTALELEDCKIMREAYARCSEWAHDQGVDYNLKIPNPDEVSDEIKILENWNKKIRDRKKIAQKDYKKYCNSSS